MIKLQPTTSKEPISRKRVKRVLSGTIVSNKMKDTIVVVVRRFVKDSRYGKYVTELKRYKADDPGNKRAVGEKVLIEECRPISKEKRFRVLTNERSE